MSDLFISTPWYALVPAVVFAVLWLFRRDFVAAVAAFFWLGYTVLETLNYLRIGCSGECNIRIDLLIIYPVLVLVSFAGFVSVAIGVVVASRRRRK